MRPATGQRAGRASQSTPREPSRCRRRAAIIPRTAMNNRRSSPPPPAKHPATAAASPWRASRERLRDREVKREAVIRAAARAFNRKGYHNTSLDDIAAALEVTKPTVYYYVTNKEQLLFECFVAGVEQIRAAFREVQRLEVPARERLNAVLRHYGEAVASEFGWCMVRAEDQDLSPDDERPHQGAEVGDRPGHPPPDPRGHPGRLDPSVRPEDDRLRAGRRAQLDRPLVPREPVHDRRARSPRRSSTVFENGLRRARRRASRRRARPPRRRARRATAALAR